MTRPRPNLNDDSDTELMDQLALRFLAPKPAAALPWPAAGRTLSVNVQTPSGWPDGSQVNVACHVMGQGPAVLLVHGWQSQAAHLGSLAQALVAAGFTVWAPDLPAHGHSEGAYLSIPLAAEALHAVSRAAGAFHVAVAHSLGGAVLVHALTQGLRADRMVLLAPPTHYGAHARRFAREAGLPDAHVSAWLARLERLIGISPDEINMVKQVASLKQKAILMHSSDDPVVSFSATKAVVQAWPQAHWHQLEGLGHFRILADREVIGKVVQAASARHGPESGPGAPQ